MRNVGAQNSFFKDGSKASDLSAVTTVRANLPHQVSDAGKVTQQTQNTTKPCQAPSPRDDFYFEP